MYEKPKKYRYYLLLMIICFAIAILSFAGVILQSDMTGRVIFGLVWAFVGIGWLGRYVTWVRKEKRGE
jgi:hypothetical protein